MAANVDLEPLRDFIRREFLFDRDAELADDQSLFGEVVDSLGVMEVLGFIEETYGVTIDNSELLVENFESLNSIAALIERQRDAG